MEHDQNTAETFRSAFRFDRFNVSSVSSGEAGLAVARRVPLALLVVDLWLPDIFGLDVLRSLRTHGVTVPFIVVGGHMPVSVVVEAMKLGAWTVLETPVNIEDLRRAVRQALEPGGTADSATPRAKPSAPQNPDPGSIVDRHATRSGSTAERWASFVLRVSSSPSDPKTITDWGRAVSVSPSALRECCRLVHVSPHNARDFARLVRAILLTGPRWQPEAILNVADFRTLTKLLRRAGLTGLTHPPTLDVFFDRQEWIAKDNPGLLALKMFLSRARASGV